ncbi:MAG: SURF1 family cytochrome oxidase biogenesis protein [Egibacteraceae bacterium]
MGEERAARRRAGILTARFLLAPRWIVAHVVVIAIAVAFVNLGLWQLRRLDERRATNALVTERMTAAPQPLDDLLAAEGDEPSALAFRRVTATGRYAPDSEVLLSPRADNEQPGHHVLTPLATPDGPALLVDRGWVPFELDRPPVAEAAPPSGEVRVSGILIPGERAERYGSRSGSDRLTFVSAVDPARVETVAGLTLRPYWLLLTGQRPATQRQLPRLPMPPEASEGPHLSYALQWFAFTLIGLVGYPLLIRKSLRARREREAEARNRRELGADAQPRPEPAEHRSAR